MENVPILSVLTFLPFFGALVISAIPSVRKGLIEKVALGISLLVFLISLPLFFLYDGAAGTFQFVEEYVWIAEFGIGYRMGVDGIGMILILLTTFISPLLFLSSWGHIASRIKEFNILYLLMMTGMIGVFAAMDLFLFYVFWEVTLIPLYFIIGIWGGPRRIYASIKFFIYTMIGSLLMLIAIIYMMIAASEQMGAPTANFWTLLAQLELPAGTQAWLFLAFGLAFAIKVPLFPFHTWLPDAHVEAPTSGSVVLASVLLKLGTYGFVRFCLPLFPAAVEQFAVPLMIIALVGILYGAFLAWAQNDMKKLVAYSSISHLGFVVLGVFALNDRGVAGGVLQMVNHGLSTGALFLLVGVIYDRRHRRGIDEYGGLGKVMPMYAAIFFIVTLSSIGLPGLNGFVGELLILQGAFESHWLLASLGALGILFGAIYMLSMYGRVFMHKVDKDENKELEDLNKREIAILLPIVIMIFAIGFFPKLFLDKFETSIEKNVLDHTNKIERSLDS
ncbi:MAG: complex I subunit 4 family protein [Planctomycetota bacterium]|jgi:NADH-quinone oxidoreductase subunit M